MGRAAETVDVHEDGQRHHRRIVAEAETELHPAGGDIRIGLVDDILQGIRRKVRRQAARILVAGKEQENAESCRPCDSHLIFRGEYPVKNGLCILQALHSVDDIGEMPDKINLIKAQLGKDGRRICEDPAEDSLHIDCFPEIRNIRRHNLLGGFGALHVKLAPIRLEDR